MDVYDKDHLPVPVEQMTWHRKTALTPMVPMVGPFVVITQEGRFNLGAGWRGWIAVDKAGYPYPVAEAEYNETYTQEP